MKVVGSLRQYRLRVTHFLLNTQCAAALPPCLNLRMKNASGTPMNATTPKIRKQSRKANIAACCCTIAYTCARALTDASAMLEPCSRKRLVIPVTVAFSGWSKVVTCVTNTDWWYCIRRDSSVVTRAIPKLPPWFRKRLVRLDALLFFSLGRYE